MLALSLIIAIWSCRGFGGETKKLHAWKPYRD